MGKFDIEFGSARGLVSFRTYTYKVQSTSFGIKFLGMETISPPKGIQGGSETFVFHFQMRFLFTKGNVSFQKIDGDGNLVEQIIYDVGVGSITQRM